MKAKPLKMRIKADAFRHAIATLAPPAQMNPQTALHVVVEISVRLPRIAKTEVGGPSSKILVQVGDQCSNRLEANRLLVSSRSRARPFVTASFEGNTFR